MRKAFLVLAGAALTALPCLMSGGASAADLAERRAAVRHLTVTRVADVCPLPAVVQRGHRGMGEPGSFVAYWEWRPTYRCDVVVGR